MSQAIDSKAFNMAEIQGLCLWPRESTYRADCTAILPGRTRWRSRCSRCNAIAAGEISHRSTPEDPHYITESSVSQNAGTGVSRASVPKDDRHQGRSRGCASRNEKEGGSDEENGERTRRDSGIRCSIRMQCGPLDRSAMSRRRDGQRASGTVGGIRDMRVRIRERRTGREKSAGGCDSAGLVR